MKSLFVFLFIIFFFNFPHLCLASSGDGLEISLRGSACLTGSQEATEAVSKSNDVPENATPACRNRCEEAPLEFQALRRAGTALPRGARNGEKGGIAAQSAEEGVSSFEQPTLIQPGGDSIDSATTGGSLISFRSASATADASGGEPTQPAIANIPPAPAEAEEEVAIIPDPIEPVNRAFFTFNDKLYFWVLKPVATGYKAVAPEVVRVCVRNFFSNLTTPVRLTNCLLQADLKCAGIETARLFINTGLGIVGFFDSAKTGFSLEKQDRDFGQTLGIWGMQPVFYIDVPIIGPSSLRDFLGFVVDLSFDPRTYLAFYISAVSYANTGGWVLDKINEASLTLGEYEELKRAALDPYIALREAYHQYRENRIKEMKKGQKTF